MPAAGGGGDSNTGIEFRDGVPIRYETTYQGEFIKSFFLCFLIIPY